MCAYNNINQKYLSWFIEIVFISTQKNNNYTRQLYIFLKFLYKHALSTKNLGIDSYQLHSMPLLRYLLCIDMSLFMSSSVSVGLHNFAIFNTSRMSLPPVFHTDEAI